MLPAQCAALAPQRRLYLSSSRRFEAISSQLNCKQRENMRRLMLLRHAKTVASDPGGDRARPLNERGRAAAPEMGRYMTRERLLPDFVLCSTARRTRQTWELLAAALPVKPQTAFEDDLYLATAEAIVALIHTVELPVTALLVVGHNPGIHQAALALAAGGRTRHHLLLQSRFPTAGLAVLDFDADSWAAIAPGRGKLDRFITPRGLAEAGQD
jgi:phosphohistidine phosphatase